MLDILQAATGRNNRVEKIISLCERGKLCCKMVRITEDEYPHRQPRKKERIIFTHGSGIIIIGNMFEEIVLHHVYEIAPNRAWAVMPFETLVGFLLLSCRYYFSQREYFRCLMPSRNFNARAYQTIARFKRAIAFQYFEQVVDLHNPHLVIDWNDLPLLKNMVKQLTV